MPGNYSIDTNIAVAFLNGDASLASRFSDTGEVFLSPVVIGELLFGAANSAKAAENTEKVEGFLADCGVLDWSLEVSRSYGSVKMALKQIGRPIPENDVWVAAFTIAHGLTLVTRDGHFDAIPGLSVERW